MDGQGPARDRATKLAICRRLYELALSRGLAPEDLLFDTATFPVASGDKSLAASALETLAAVRGLDATCPGSLSVLGVGNSSFGLPRAQRPAFTSRFVAAARAAGLGAAIVDPATLAIAVPEALADAADALIEARHGTDGYGEAVERLLSLGQPAPGAQATDTPASLPPEGTREAGSPEEVAAAVLAGDSKRAVRAVSAAVAAATLSPAATAGAIAGAMAELGRRYDAGSIALPLVLRSADAARDAFAALRASSPRDAPGTPGRPEATVVLSTVRGDLHDIGKNLVGMVLEAAGFDVRDLGTDRSADDIAAAALESGAIAVGVSGLLTRSLVEMEKVALALADAGSKALLICGGAAVDREYVAERIEPLRPGLVAYGKDPFEAVGLLERPRRLGEPDSTGRPRGHHQSAMASRQPRRNRQGNGRAESDSSRAPHSRLPSSGRLRWIPSPSKNCWQPWTSTPWSVRAGHIQTPSKAARRWPMRRASSAVTAESRRRAATVISSPAQGTTTSSSCPSGSSRWFAFRFPREPGGERRSVADYWADDDVAAAFCVTLGSGATDYLATVRAAGDSSAYLRAHGLLAGLAEAAAELVHRRLALWLAGRGAASAGKRYSFGFPGCPGVEFNADLLELLSAGEIGLRTTAGHQLDPEFSVTAVLVPRAVARYIDA